MRLSDGEIATLDAATELSPIYRNWFSERPAEQTTAQALVRTRA